jgi:hypothetical protein
VKWILLRGLIAIIVPGALYAIYLWYAGERARSDILFIVIAVPTILTGLRIKEYISGR